MATTAPQVIDPNNKSTYSCTRCAERKVKCDRNKPCTACMRHRVDCVYSPWHTPRNKHRRVAVQALSDRLKQYEALLRQNGIDPSQSQRISGADTSHQPTQNEAGLAEGSQPKGPLRTELQAGSTLDPATESRVQGRFKFVNNILWASVAEELSDAPDDLENRPDCKGASELSINDFSFVLGSQAVRHAKRSHPPPERIRQLWHIFVVNFDPLTKILHVPTVQPSVERAASSIDGMSQSFEALLFAIYSAAVMSLTDDICKQEFGETRKALLSQYTSAAKAALSWANFMQTTDLVVLQALVIFLLAVRDMCAPRAVWTLTGVAVRIAQGMGLDRDGVHLGLSPFETEMRRRVWWQLKTHDFRTAELCGMQKFKDLDTGSECTRWPACVNDCQLYPAMSSPATEFEGWSDASFVSLKCDLLKSASDTAAALHRQGKASRPWDLEGPGTSRTEVEKSCNELEAYLETKYLRYCDPSQHLHLMTMLMARCAVNVVRFMLRHPRRWARKDKVPVDERREIWNICIRLLEQHNMLQSNPMLKQFAWYAQYFQQWHAMIHVLDTLRGEPLHEGADKAWGQIGIIYECNWDMVTNTGRPIHIAVGNLCLKAYENREVALRSSDLPLPSTPCFVVQLRQQREAGIPKIPTSSDKSVQPGREGSQIQAASSDKGQGPKSISGNTANAGTSPSDQTRKHRADPSLPRINSPDHRSSKETELFSDTHLSYGNHQGIVGDQDMPVNCSLEDMYGLGNSPMSEDVWGQWDSWLEDSNLMQISSDNGHCGS